MRKIYLLVLIFFFPAIEIFSHENSLTNRIILKLKKDFSFQQNFPGNPVLSKTDLIHIRHRALSVKKFPAGRFTNEYFYSINFPPDENIPQIIQEYLNTGEVVYAEPDYSGSADGFTPNDQLYSRQWNMKNHGNFSLHTAKAGADINIDQAWEIEQGDSNIIIGIIDSGIRSDHPEFSGRIWKNFGEVPANGLDDDGNGYIDDVNSWDFVHSDNNPSDDNGHGMAVAGIIGAQGNNSSGYAGINWNSKLMVIKGLDNNALGIHSWWAAALYYAVDNGAKVINMSFSSPDSSITLQNAINYALQHNVTLVASMGNLNSGAKRYPAAYPGVIAVGSTNPDGKRTKNFFWSNTNGSNYGNHISVVAPGNFVYSLTNSTSNYNVYWGGTSFATPHVTGLASLILSRNPLRTPVQIRSIITGTATDRSGDPSEDAHGWDQYHGFGMINASRALAQAIGVRINSQPVSLTTCESTSDINFSVGAELVDSSAQIHYQWFKGNFPLSDNGRISGATSATLRIIDVMPEDSGSYFVQVSIGAPNEPISSDRVTLSVTPKPKIIAQPVPAWICEGASHRFYVSATGPNLRYQWQKDGQIIPGATDSAFRTSSSGAYQVNIRNSCGEILSQVVEVKIITPVRIMSHPASATVCGGQSHVLSVSAAGSGLRYQWRKDGIDIPGASSSSYRTSAPGEYCVAVSNYCSNALSGIAKVEIFDFPEIVQQPVSAVICEGENFLLRAAVLGEYLSYQWQLDGADIPEANFSFYRADSPGSYTLKIKNPCGEILSQSAIINVGQAPIVSAQPGSKFVCNGSSTRIAVSASGTNLLYQWQKNRENILGENSSELLVKGAGEYRAIIRNSCGEIFSQTAYIVEKNIPSIRFQPASTALFQGSSLNLSIGADNVAEFQWFHNEKEISGATSSSYEKNNISLSDAGRYKVLMTNECGEIFSNEAIIDIISSVSEKADSDGFMLKPIQPNPVLGNCLVEFSVPEYSAVTIDVLDALGRKISTIAEGNFDAGHHLIELRTSDLNIPSGTYFITLTGNGTKVVQRISVAR